MPDEHHDPVAWVLAENEPSLTWRVLTELQGRPSDDPEVEKARGRIGAEGWAAKVLGEQLPSGQWDSPGTRAGELYRPKYIATNWRLLVLSDLGVTRSNPGVERAVELLFAAHASPEGDLGGSGSETCFTGNAVRMLSRFGYAEDPRLRAAIDWLLANQKADGGWHCWPSETGAIDCWEPLAAFDALPRSMRTLAVERAIERGAEFYLSKGLLGEGDEEYPPWRRMHYPVHYYYDFLVGLDTLTRLGFGRDPRLTPALNHLAQLRNSDGTWTMGPAHPDLPTSEVEYRPEPPLYPFVLEYPGRPSRWLTITALAVLRRAGRWNA
ncbi:MAG: prenyltransferase/squalene oxidase repeat-containing protein [Thermoplasmata archaeon]